MEPIYKEQRELAILKDFRAWKANSKPGETFDSKYIIPELDHNFVQSLSVSLDNILDILEMSLNTILEQKTIIHQKDQIITQKDQIITQKDQIITRSEFYKTVSEWDTVDFETKLEKLIDDCAFEFTSDEYAEMINNYRFSKSGLGDPINTNDHAQSLKASSINGERGQYELSSFNRGLLIGTKNDINYYNLNIDLDSIKRIILKHYFQDEVDLENFIQAQSWLLTLVRRGLFGLSQFSSKCNETDSQEISIHDARSKKISFKLEVRVQAPEKKKPEKKSSPPIIKNQELTLNGYSDIAVASGAAFDSWKDLLAHIELKTPFYSLQHEQGNKCKGQLLGETIGIGAAIDELQDSPVSSSSEIEEAGAMVFGILTDGIVLYLLIRMSSNQYGITHHVKDENEFILYLLFAACRKAESDVKDLVQSSKGDKVKVGDDGDEMLISLPDSDDEEEEAKTVHKRKFSWNEDSNHGDGDDSDQEGGEPGNRKHYDGPAGAGSKTPGTTQIKPRTALGTTSTSNLSNSNAKKASKRNDGDRKQKMIVINLKANDDEENFTSYSFNSSRLHAATKNLSYNPLARL